MLRVDVLEREMCSVTAAFLHFLHFLHFQAFSAYRETQSHLKDFPVKEVSEILPSHLGGLLELVLILLCGFIYKSLFIYK